MKRFLAAITLAAAFVNLATAEQPNILWITTEDISCELGCYGDKFADTPNLDALAGQGIRYTNFFAESPMCAPSRATIITGMHNGPLGASQMRSNHRIPEFVRPFSAFLRDAGYYCTNNSKTDYNSARDASGQNREFISEAWDASGKDAHWRNRPEGSPFFAIFNYVDTHQSRASRDDYEIFKANVQSRLDPGRIHDPAKAPVPPHYADGEISRKTVARYYDCITTLDDYVGKLLGQLETDGLADSTIIFFYSDHGAGMPTGKALVSDYGLRCPLLVHIPEKFRHIATGEQGTVSDRLVCFADLAPTMLNLLGIERPDYFHGTPFLGKSVPEAPKYVLGTRDRMDETLETTRWISDGKYLLVRSYRRDIPVDQQSLTNYYNGNGEICQEIRRLKKAGELNNLQLTFWSDQRPAYRLFHSKSDPWNTKNLADDPAQKDRVAEMEKALDSFLTKEVDLGFFPEPELARAEEEMSAYEVARLPGRYPIQRILAAAKEENGEALRAALSDENANVRYWSVVGLSAQEEPARNALPQLKQMLGDESVSVRLEAAELVTSLTESPEALDLLADALMDPNEWVACRAARALELLGEKAATKVDAIHEALAARVPANATKKEKQEAINYGFEFSLLTALANLE